MTTEREKDFDSVQHMRELRDRISRDIEGMTFEEEKAYIRERLEWARLQHGTTGQLTVIGMRGSDDVQPENRFDAVQFMREARERMSREMDGMTEAQILRYICRSRSAAHGS